MIDHRGKRCIRYNNRLVYTGSASRALLSPPSIARQCFLANGAKVTNRVVVV